MILVKQVICFVTFFNIGFDKVKLTSLAIISTLKLAFIKYILTVHRLILNYCLMQCHNASWDDNGLIFS